MTVVSKAVCRDDYHLPVPSCHHVTGRILEAAGNMAGQCVQAALQGDDYLRPALRHYQPDLQAGPLPESKDVSKRSSKRHCKHHRPNPNPPIIH